MNHLDPKKIEEDGLTALGAALAEALALREAIERCEYKVVGEAINIKRPKHLPDAAKEIREE